MDDIVKFISDPPSPPRLEDVPAEGKGKTKEPAKSVRVTTPSPLKITRTMMMRDTLGPISALV
jgi:hypothetical protein